MLRLGPNQLRQHLEQQIAAVAKDIDVLNEKIAEVDELIKERRNLRNKLDSLIIQLNIITDAESEFKPLFVFKGKNKNLSGALQSEIRKAQK